MDTGQCVLQLIWTMECEKGQLLQNATIGQSNLTKSASQGAHSPVRGHPRGSKVVPLNSWGIIILVLEPQL